MTAREAPASAAEDLLTKRAVADRLGVSVRTVERLAATGELPAVHLSSRITRFTPADVDALIQRRRT